MPNWTSILSMTVYILIFFTLLLLHTHFYILLHRASSGESVIITLTSTYIYSNIGLDARLLKALKVFIWSWILYWCVWESQRERENKQEFPCFLLGVNKQCPHIRRLFCVWIQEMSVITGHWINMEGFYRLYSSSSVLNCPERFECRCLEHKFTERAGIL